MNKKKPVIYYGKVISTTSEQTIELIEEINGKCEINIEIPLTWEMENFILGRDKLQ